MKFSPLAKVANQFKIWQRLKRVPEELREVNNRLDNLPYEIASAIRAGELRFPRIRCKEETLEILIRRRCSICRYGDGEFRLAAGRAIGFQDADPELAQRLTEILRSKGDDILVALPPVFGSLEDFVDEARDFWRAELAATRQFLSGLIDFDKQYDDAFLTRPYYVFRDRSNAACYFEQMRRLWAGESIVVVEGANTRLGCGNDLLNGASSVSRIIGPAVNAYAKYGEILREVSRLAKGKTVLIALGPTATVMAYDLARMGFRAIDIGHIDIEYEWYLRKAVNKIPLPGKHVNEQRRKGDLDPVEDRARDAQVISRVDH